MSAPRLTWATAALAVGTLACSGGDGETPADGAPADSSAPRQITYEASHWTEAGEVAAPAGFDAAALSVRQLDDSGRLVEVELSWDGDTATVSEDARPPLYVSYGPDMVVTDFRSLDVGRRMPGRPNPARIDGPNAAELVVSGFDPENAGPKSLRLVVPNVGYHTAVWELQPSDWPLYGETEASFLIGFPTGAPVIDAALGDRSHFYQLGDTGGTWPSSGLTRHGTADFSPAERVVTIEMAAPTASGRMELSYQTAAFEAVGNQLQPRVGPVRHDVLAVAHAGPADLAAGTSATLAAQRLWPEDGDVGAVDVPYGDPFDDRWRDFVVASCSGEVPLALDDRPLGALPVASTTVLPVDDARGVSLAPVVSAPRDVTLDGMPAAGQVEIADDQAILAWSPPHLGTPDHYVIEIFAVGLYPELRGTIVTRETSVVLAGDQLPAMDVARAYRISAVVGDRAVESRPFDQPMRRSEAQTATGVVWRP